MNFVVICLHSLDMRDFHSLLRTTPFLDTLKSQGVYFPMGRGQCHHQGDSLNPEMTGLWSTRYTDSTLTADGFTPPQECLGYPTTVVEYLANSGYDVINLMDIPNGDYESSFGTAAFKHSLAEFWLEKHPDRLQFLRSSQANGVEEWLERIHASGGPFYAHIHIRTTHRPWGQPEGLCALTGMPTRTTWPEDAWCARLAALKRPDEFAAIRRRGLEEADKIVRRIIGSTAEIADTTYLIYSNHGEVFDFFRMVLPYRDESGTLQGSWPSDSNLISRAINGTSHGPLPYEILYANMQLWLIPGIRGHTMRGVAHTVDIPATILDLAGLPDVSLDGHSLLNFVNEGVVPPRERIAENRWACVSLVREDGIKYLSTGVVNDQGQSPSSGPEFHVPAAFDLRQDPFEYCNLIDTDVGREAEEWAIQKHRELKQVT